ncbi:MAG: radical SAM protein [Bacteroidales bacterium]|nr:radical SAM protein [Bacteroidales bacterium]
MLREETVFGPIHSRRLGNSLGVNLLPRNGKVCNFDCIYCECGWNKDGVGGEALPTAAQVCSALEDKLAALLLDGTSIDSITFSGDGEPSLNPEFPRIIDDTLALRDAYCPGAKVSVLSNATRVHIPEVFVALSKVDNPIMKIDAPTNELARLINNPAPGYDVASVVEALKRFKGDFCLQTMFLRSPAFRSDAPEVLDGWKAIVRELRPRQIMVYTIDRPTPQSGLDKFTPQQMRDAVSDLIKDGFNIQICG